MTTDYYTLCEVMESLVSVRDKEDIASTLVHIMQKLDKAKEFLTEVIIGEVLKQGMPCQTPFLSGKLWQLYSPCHSKTEQQKHGKLFVLGNTYCSC